MRRQSTIAATPVRGVRPLAKKDAFPYLDTREITSCLLECDFNVSLDLVAKPTSEFIISLFTHFLEVFMGIDNLYDRSKDQAKRRLQVLKRWNNEPAAGTNAEGPDPNGGAVDADIAEEDDIDPTPTDEILTMYRCCRKFFHNIGVEDLSLLDLTRPEGASTRRLLSAVVNYLRFREGISSEYDELAQEADATTNRIQQLQEENEARVSQINDLQRRLTFEDDGRSDVPRHELQHVLNYNRKLESKLRQLKETQERLTNQHDDYKTEKNTLAQRLNDIGYRCDETTGEIENLKNYKEKDIGQLTTIVNDLDTDVEGLIKTFVTFDKQYQNLGKTLDTMQVNELSVKNLIKVAEEISKSMNKDENDLYNIRQHNDKLQSITRESNDLAKQIETRSEQLAKYEKKYDDLEEQYKKKLETLTEKLKQTNQALDDVMKLKTERGEENKRTSSLIKRIEQETDDIISNFAKEVKFKEAQLAQLQDLLKSYIERLSKTFLKQREDS
ncbi:NUF2 [Candida theae]|uniref:NUF2 n=1 Tax=Candida theae TaxID=1198502 RepID=A0AAD5BGU8_9ASCO|nr:NUF2 [Candida theae]KAI5961693.1 NUF2 [Candida theae]